jgi:hypothetical protein
MTRGERLGYDRVGETLIREYTGIFSPEISH